MKIQTRFKEGDLTVLSQTMFIPEHIKLKNIVLNNILTKNKRPDFPFDDEFGIIISSIVAGNYVGYIWFSQKRLDYFLVFEEDIEKA